MKHTTCPAIPRRGMTIVELLVVMGIALVLMALVAGSFQSVARSTELTNSVQSVADTLNTARQAAVARNGYTQVRFYLASPSDFRAGHFTSMAIFIADAPYYTSDYTQVLGTGRMRPEGQIVKLPQSCVIVNNATFSPLLQTLASDSARQVKLSDGTTGVAFYFKPDGSLDVPATSGGAPTVNVLSICEMQGLLGAAGSLPLNYGILNVDRVNGRFQVVRP